MPHILRILLLAVPAMLMAVGCTHSRTETAEVPRPKAYPRAGLYDSLYSTVDSLPLHLELNSQATVATERKNDGTLWVTASYPDYNAKMYITLTPVDERTIDDVMSNRLRRMALNIGDNAEPEDFHLEAGSGFETTVLFTADPEVPTPIQFLSTDGRQWVVSGTAYFRSPGQSADSLFPYVDAVRRDVAHTFTTIDYAAHKPRR